MNIKPSKVTYVIEQTRFITVEISEASGCDMPADISGCISLNDEIRENPTAFIEDESKWQWVDNKVDDLKWHE